MAKTNEAIAVADVEALLEHLYIAAEGATLRREDRRKAVFVHAFLGEIARAASRSSSRDPFVLVDAAAGKSCVGLLSAALVLAGRRDARVVTIERDPARVERSREAAGRLPSACAIACIVGDVADPACWPERPTIVAALHACGDAADRVIDRAIETQARHVLLVPCCTSHRVDAVDAAVRASEHLGIPKHAPVRRRFLQSIVDAERTLRLEAAGYETEVVEVVAPAVSPFNVLYRARRVGESQRSRRAADQRATLLSVYK